MRILILLSIILNIAMLWRANLDKHTFPKGFETMWDYEKDGDFVTPPGESMRVKFIPKSHLKSCRNPYRDPDVCEHRVKLLMHSYNRKIDKIYGR